MPDSTTRLKAALSDRYTVEREVGSGGMAMVYLARDVRHDRRVAVKVLRPELAAVLGADRFLSEIRTTANLQHPHILPLFDSGEADGFLFYVMPYVEEETVHDLIDREKQLAVDKAVDIASKVAQALDHAHRHGVIHRDIKPANILLHEGEPVVADFGIALAVQEAGGGRLTETGLSLGTPFYMSPEQATGDRVPDARSDVYALGSVLYEMLTGEPPFQGKTAQSVLGKILTGDVTPPTDARASVPPHVSAVVMKALERLPADRFESAAAMADALSDPGFRHGETAEVGAAGTAGFWKPVAVVMTAAATVLATLLALGDVAPAGSLEPLRLGIPIPDEFPLLSPGAGSPIQISDNGSMVAYIGLNGDDRQLFVRGRGELEPRPLGNTNDARIFFLSPDGREVAFLRGSDQALHAVLTQTGVIRTIADSVGDFAGDWTVDGWIYFQNQRSGISRVPSVGGPVETLTTHDQGAINGHTWVDVLPGGQTAVMTKWGATAASDSIVAIDFRTGEITTLVQGTMARYTGSRYLVYATNSGQLLAVSFDPDALQLTGPSLPILDGVRVGPNGESEFSLSATGSLVYRAGAPGGGQQLVWMDRAGTVTQVDSTFVGDLNYPALSPDGDRVAFQQTVNGRPELWVKRLDQPDAPAQRLTFDGDGTDVRRPAWSPDGTTIYYAASRDQTSLLMARSADGTGQATEVIVSDSVLINEISASPDGEWLVLRLGANPTSRDLVGYRVAGDGDGFVPLVDTPFDEHSPTVSPDGRWLAYVSNQAGRNDVYVRPFPGTGEGVWRVTSGGGSEPVWGKEAKELFYKSDLRRMMLATLDFTNGVTVSERQTLFETGSLIEDPNHHTFSIHPDDGRILTIWRGDEGGTPLIWIENFLTEIERRFSSEAMR